jgi:hypothetical protein
MEVVDFIFRILEISFGIGKIITETLTVVVLAGHWVRAVDDIWVYVT